MNPSDPFAPTPLFSFPLHASVIAGFEAHREPLRAHVLDLKRRYPGVVRSNRGAWHSGAEFLAHRSEHVAWLLEKVTKFGRHALARYHDNWAKSELTLAGSWANVLGPGGWNAPHHHFPCHWSGVFYISVGEVGDSRENPSGMIEFLNPNPGLALIGLSGNFLYPPKDGLMLVFPATLHHFVHPVTGGADRISIAYNFEVKPR